MPAGGFCRSPITWKACKKSSAASGLVFASVTLERAVKRGRVCVAEVEEIVPLGSLDPVRVAPLTDAGVTSYRAVKASLDRLHPGS